MKISYSPNLAPWLDFALFTLFVALALPFFIPRLLSQRGRAIEAALLACWFSLPLIFPLPASIHFFGPYALPLYCAVRLYRTPPGTRLYLVPSALLGLAWLFWGRGWADVAACVSPLVCAALFKSRSGPARPAGLAPSGS